MQTQIRTAASVGVSITYRTEVLPYKEVRLDLRINMISKHEYFILKYTIGRNLAFKHKERCGFLVLCIPRVNLDFTAVVMNRVRLSRVYTDTIHDD